MTTQDLWGDLPLSTSARTPVSILREQAALLGQKTNNLLRGEVIFQRSTIDPSLTADFAIIAPLLDSYFYHLLTIRYPVTLYPVILEPDSNTREPNLPPDRPIECPDEEKFIQALSGILARPQVKKVISLLIAQSKENS